MEFIEVLDEKPDLRWTVFTSVLAVLAGAITLQKISECE